MLSEVDKAYAAGFFDGEGHMQLVRNNNGKYYAKTTVSQNAPEVLVKFQSVWGGGIYLQKKCHYWKIGKGSDVLVFLKDIRPYLVVKLKEVNFVLACDGLYDEGDAQFLKSLRKEF